MRIDVAIYRPGVTDVGWATVQWSGDQRRFTIICKTCGASLRRRYRAGKCDEWLFVHRNGCVVPMERMNGNH